jgi:hypothetical protein
LEVVGVFSLSFLQAPSVTATSRSKEIFLI